VCLWPSTLHPLRIGSPSWLTMLLGPIINPDNGLLTPPPSPHGVSRSKTITKPRRSSPLAGPAVMPVEVDIDEGASVHSRVSSFNAPQDFGLHPLSPQARVTAPVVPSRPAPMQSDYPTSDGTSDSEMGFQELNRRATLPTVISLDSTAANEEENTKANLFKRSSASFQTRRDLHKPRRTSDSQMLSFALPPSTVTSEQVIVSNSSEAEKADDSKVSFESPPSPPPARVKSRTGKTSPKDNSWYISNTYGETPRFTRLSLASDNVILPISARAYRKQHFNRHSEVPSSGVVESPNVSACRTSNRRSLISMALSSGLRLSESVGMPDPKAFTVSPPSSPSLTTLTNSHLRSLDSSQGHNRRSRTSLTGSLSTSSYRHSSSAYSALSILSDSTQTSIGKGAPATEEQNESCVPTVAYTRADEPAEKINRSKSFIAKMKRWTVTSSTIPVEHIDGLKSATGAESIPSETPLTRRKSERLRRIGTVKAFFRFFVVSG
jgi:hypothetical protein